MSVTNDWFDAEAEDQDDFSIEEYDLTATPNDFNLKTIVDFIDRGVFVIPDFQRSYVWDVKRASKLIESLLIGLPIPQVFLYQEGRNRYLVIDGQQRLLSIYFFVKSSFPKVEKRQALRQAMSQADGQNLASMLGKQEFFDPFKLQLPASAPNADNRFHGMSYEDLNDHQTTLDLRTIRCVMIKQNTPAGDDSSVYEIFHRLNTGGVNLTPQEIRASLYHSKFFNMIDRINTDPRWREIIGAKEPDLRMRDVEFLVRAFAMLLHGSDYRPSMTRFLNGFAKEMQTASPELLVRLEATASEFLDACRDLPGGVFGTGRKRLNISVFESVFAAVCIESWQAGSAVRPIEPAHVAALKADREFVEAASKRAGNRTEVLLRLERARHYLLDSGVAAE